MRRAAPLAWVLLLAACGGGGGGGPSTGTASVGGHFVAHPAITHVSVLQGGTIWWDCTRAAANATSPSALSTGAQVQVRAYFNATPGASASLVDSCGGAIAPAGSSPDGGGVEAYATFAWTAPATPSACILTPRVTVPGPLQDAFPIVVRVGTPAAAHLGALASRLTTASGVWSVAATVAGLTQDLAYVPADGTFSGTIASVPAGPQTVTATAYDAGSHPVGTGSGQATVVAGATVPVSVTVYDTTGPPAVPDHGPVVLALGVPAATATVGASQTLSATAMDADAGDAITFAWSTTPDGCGTFSGSTATTTTASTHWTAATAGTCTVTVTVTSNARTDARSAGILVSLALAIAPDPASVALDAVQQFTRSPALPVTWSVTAVPGSPPPPTVFPVQVSADGRYVVDQNLRPWRIQADAAWLMSTNATLGEVRTYLDKRKAQGFNSFYLMAMVHPGGYGAAPNAPNDAAGDPPFATPNVFSTAGVTPESERYWAWIDAIVDEAAQRGMAVMLAYTYLGYVGGDQGWYATLLAQPDLAACTAWGQWLGNRYKGKPNVIWFALGDFTPPAGSGEARALAIIDGIKSAGAKQLFMAEPSGGDANPVMDAPAFASRLDLNSFYGYGLTGHGECYVQADRAYRNVSPPKPAWVQEGGYEFENNTGGFTGASWETRRTRFWSVLAGGTAGDGFGTRDVYQWLGLPTSLSTEGATFSSYAFELFATLPWWRLRPSGTGFARKVLVTAGQDVWGGLDYVTSAATDEGSLLLAYVPTIGGTTARAITIDMTAMRGPSRARWFNPAKGEYTVIVGPDPGGTFPNDAPRSFTTPGNNGTGTNDWVLVLDEGDAPCGRIDATGLYVAPSTIPPGVECQVVATLEADPSVVARATVSLHH